MKPVSTTFTPGSVGTRGDRDTGENHRGDATRRAVESPSASTKRSSNSPPAPRGAYGRRMSDEIRPFTIDVPEAVLDDLHTRLRHTRWPDREVVEDWSQGIPLAYVRELAAYWADGYDWRTRERGLNRFDQFVTEIDGLDIHFIHHRSPHPHAVPLLITHGWPGSIVEFHKVIEPLTDPVAFGGDAGRRVPRDRAVAPRLCVLRQADRAGVGGRTDRRRVGDADGPPRLRPLPRTGRRLGLGRHLAGGRAGPGALRRDPPHARDVVTTHRRPQRARRAARARADQVLRATGTRGTRRSSRPGPRPSATACPTHPPVNSRGSSRSSGRGPTATATPSTPSAATRCSTT